MSITKVVHEGGLIAKSILDSKETQRKYRVRPILVVEARPTGDIVLLLNRLGTVLDADLTTLYSAAARDGSLLLKTLALMYDTGAVVHHCANLAKAYESIVINYQRIRTMPGYPISDSDSGSFGYQPEPYYELDALLSASRRVYDKIAQYVWHAFEGRGGGAPTNMTQALGRLKSCPKDLAERLRGSWTTVGERLKDYRDCTQHFASVDFGLGTITMRRVCDDIWKATARIPDNPEAKSKRRFTYRLGMDALTYGWEVANEVTVLAAETVTTVSSGVRR